jgi:hypothetical protein
MAAAASTVKRIALELGGKNPNVVFADADFETAVDFALTTVFLHSGQVCSAGARLIVEEPLHDRFVDEVVRRAERITLGGPFDPNAATGALISAAHRDKVEAYVAAGLVEGAVLRCGGRRPDEEHLRDGAPSLGPLCATVSGSGRYRCWRTFTARIRFLGGCPWCRSTCRPPPGAATPLRPNRLRPSEVRPRQDRRHQVRRIRPAYTLLKNFRWTNEDENSVAPSDRGGRDERPRGPPRSSSMLTRARRQWLVDEASSAA